MEVSFKFDCIILNQIIMPQRLDTFYKYGWTLISAGISYNIHYDAWDEITFLFPDLKFGNP